jgi:hypothetical protein
MIGFFSCFSLRLFHSNCMLYLCTIGAEKKKSSSRAQVFFPRRHPHVRFRNIHSVGHWLVLREAQLGKVWLPTRRRCRRIHASRAWKKHPLWNRRQYIHHVRLPPGVFFLVALIGIGETESAARQQPQKDIDCPRGCEEDGHEDDNPMLGPRTPFKKSNKGYWEYLHRIR